MSSPVLGCRLAPWMSPVSSLQSPDSSLQSPVSSFETPLSNLQSPGLQSPGSRCDDFAFLHRSRDSKCIRSATVSPCTSVTRQTPAWRTTQDRTSSLAKIERPSSSTHARHHLRPTGTRSGNVEACSKREKTITMVFDELLALIYHEYTATPFQAMESTKKRCY